jgi:hypothetical protein
MKNVVLLSILAAFVMIFSGCTKTAPAANDATTPWVGTYAGSPGSSLTEIQISRAGDNMLKIVLKVNQFSYIYTATTLQSVSITGSGAATIAEDQHIIESTDLGLYGFKGSVSLSGTHVNLTATATNLQSGASSEYNPMNFTFSGDKVQ